MLWCLNLKNNWTGVFAKSLKAQSSLQTSFIRAHSVIRWMIKTNSSHFAYCMNVEVIRVPIFLSHRKRVLIPLLCSHTQHHRWLDSLREWYGRFFGCWGRALGVNVYAWLDYSAIISPSSRHVILHGGRRHHHHIRHHRPITHLRIVRIYNVPSRITRLPPISLHVLISGRMGEDFFKCIHKIYKE